MPHKRRQNSRDDLENGLDLKSVHKKITEQCYWSGNVWMEMMANNLFNDLNDHTYCAQNQSINEKSSQNIMDSSNKLTYEINNLEFMEFDVQNCVEIQCNEETTNIHKEDISKHECKDDSTKESIICNTNDGHVEMLDSKSEENYASKNNEDTVCSYIMDDSGIESSDSLLAENDDAVTATTMIENSCRIKATIDEKALEDKDKKYARDGTDRIIGKNELPVKRCSVARKNREVLVSEESPIIEGEFEQLRRVTRLLVKSNVDKPIKRCVDNVPGKLVWGYFRTGWWPALIIKAEDAGMISTAGKIWVSWIGESLISELREKNVESFSSDLETRLNNLETSAKTKVNNKKVKEQACYKTIQLLKKYFIGGALVKPYISWIKNHILPQKEKLDELLFYPYPESLSEKLNELKKVNFEKNEKYLHQQEKERLSKMTEVKNSLKKVEKVEKPIEEGGINIIDQKPGMIVWAKMQGYSLWPCVIMNYQHLNRKQPNVAHQWVMWYGDYKYSQVEYRQILTFPVGIEKMEPKILAMKDDLFSKAVLRASKDFCEQLGYLTEPWKLDDVIHLFFKSKDRFKLKNTQLNEPNDDDLYSQTIKKQLRKQINNQPVSEERKRKILKSKNLQSVLTGDLSLETLCITCFESDEKLNKHPFFYASMCDKCLEEFGPKMFAYGNDAKCFYCTLCGGEDLVAMCDSMNCPRVFCTACIKYIICPEYYEQILLKHPWYCFLCDSSSIEFKDSVIKIRKNWKNNMISIYRLNCDDKAPLNLERIDRNKKIRVLSLFDGIATGLVVLKKLNINIECYYASEIDPDSMQVSFFNHGHEVMQLGDIRNIDEKKIKEIAPIDLLIGGSPCNELSLANPKRRGLDDPEGTGILFYDYCRIKKLVKKHNKKRHLFWLFENVASMPKKYRIQISENLGREPKFLDSADFSAQHRPRLYWGNLPWGPYQVNDVILQDVLRKRCNRQALVKKIMTVTTRTNSLNQTKENLKPVLMDGKKDMLWVTELEEIFGFPIHYTDANLQKTRRLQLIGKAWSVQTLTAILRPLFYF